MSALGKIVRRNCLLYFKDKSAVFFSLMSMGIVLLLMVVFLGDMNVDSIVGTLQKYAGERDTAVDKENAGNYVLLWTVAGIVIVNAVMVTMTMIGYMVIDKMQGKIVSFYVAPVNRYTITLGYILASVIVGIIICIITVVAAAIYMAAGGFYFLTVEMALKILGVIVLIVFSSSSLMFLLAVFVNSESAWSGIGTVIGTLVGFLGGMYLPIGALPDTVGSIMKALPIIHECALLRTIMMGDIIDKTFSGAGSEIVAEYSSEMGITLDFMGKGETAIFQVLFILGYGIIALVVATVIVSKKGVRDR